MLSMSHSLAFPKLVFVNNTKFKAWGDDENRVFRLDWTYKEQQRERFPSLPHEYDDILKNQHFVIGRNYIRQIRHATDMAVMEWAKDYPFDTMIREICLEPAIAYADVAFKLICDCRFDVDTNKWDRRPETTIIRSLCLVKFWSDQTGRGLLGERGEFTRLKNMLGYEHVRDDEKKIIATYLEDMEAFWAGRDQLMNVSVPLCDGSDLD